MAASEPLPFSLEADGLRLAVRLTPGAKADSIEGAETDAAGKAWLRIRITAPPVDGKANAALIKLLAKRWRLSKSAIAITSGATARTKILSLQGDPDQLRSLIEPDL
jgi:uncharacterized protein (TIGR00251 family)